MTTGGSNVQMGIDPEDGEMMIIEMNPRVSRSSALASKATGFPIAKIAAKLAVGLTLDQIPNDITLKTPASFEPSIDYIVTKVCIGFGQICCTMQSCGVYQNPFLCQAGGQHHGCKERVHVPCTHHSDKTRFAPFAEGIVLCYGNMLLRIDFMMLVRHDTGGFTTGNTSPVACTCSSSSDKLLAIGILLYESHLTSWSTFTCR